MIKGKFGAIWQVFLAMMLLLSLGLVIAVQTATPVLAATITTAGSGSWNSITPNAPWPGGVIPGATDKVVIASGHTVTIPGGYTATCGDIVITGTLDFLGTTTGELDVRGGGTSPVTTGSVSGSGTINGVTSGGCDIKLYGNWSFNGAIINRLSVAFQGPNDATVSAVSANSFRNIYFEKAANTTLYLSVTPQHNYNFYMTSGSICYNQNGAQNVIPATYPANLTLAGSGAKTLPNSKIVGGSSSSPQTTTIIGVLSMEGTATATVTGTLTYGASATLQYKTTDTRTVGTEWPATFVGTGGVIIANPSGSLTLNGAKVFSASVPLTINSGATLSTSGSNYALTFGGNYTNNGGTFTANASPITIANTMATQSIDGFTTTGIVSMTKTGGTATFTGNVSGGALTINGSGGTLNLGTGLTHTFTGTWTRTAGTLDGGSSTLNLGGGLSGTGGTFTAGTSTVNYNAAGAQTVAGVTYYNLMTSGSGTKTLGGAVIVNGNLTIGSSTTLDVSSNNYGLTVKGNWSNSGTFTQRSGTVTLSGSNAQTMTGATTFYNLILNNNNGLTINSDETVSNMLTLTNGKISTGSNKVIISSTSGAVTRTNGYVIGNLQKNVATGSSVSRTFEVGATNYDPVIVAFTSVSVAGNLIGNVTTGEHPNIGSCTIDSSKDVNVYWSFNNSGITFTSYNATFNFIAGDIDGGANTANFIAGKYDAGWTYPTVGTKTSTSTQVTGVTSLSDFVLGEAAAPSTITVTAPSAIDFGTLVWSPDGELNKKQSGTSGNVTVTLGGSATGWQVMAKNVTGYMKTGNTTLANKLQISKDGSSWAYADIGIIYTGTGAGNYTLPFWAKQVINTNEVVGAYSIIIEFTGGILY
jgi:hypothetical protein